MITLKIAWRDIMRQRARTWLTVSAITFSAAIIFFTMAISRGMHQSMIQGAVSMFTGHFQVQAKGYLDEPALDKSFPLPTAILAKLEQDKRVKGVAPRLVTQGLAASDKSTVGSFIVGVDPVREPKATALAGNLRSGRFLIDGDTQAVVIGKTMADNMGIEPGSEIQLMTQSFYGSLELRFYHVIGTVSTGTPEFDQTLLIMPLDQLQDFLEMNGYIDELAVILHSPRDREGVMNEVRPLLAKAQSKHPLVLVDWEHLIPELVEFVYMDDAGGVLYVAILIIVVAFVVLLTILMSVMERLKEFGVMLAIGTRPRRIFGVIMIESLLIGLLGVGLGLIIGSLPSWWLAVHPYVMTSYAGAYEQFGIEPMIKTIILPVMYPATAAILMIITLGVSILPAVRASRVKPVEALRHV